MTIEEAAHDLSSTISHAVGVGPDLEQRLAISAQMTDERRPGIGHECPRRGVCRLRGTQRSFFSWDMVYEAR
jgi:hypothetical protein